MAILFFDVETTGLPLTRGWGKYYPPTDLAKYAPSRVVQVSWLVADRALAPIKTANHVIRPAGFRVAGTEFHGITQERAEAEGVPITEALRELAADARECDLAVAHNAGFDVNIVKSEMARADMLDELEAFGGVRVWCSMEGTRDLVGLPSKYGGGCKPPKLSELYEHVAGAPMQNAHDSLYDVLNMHASVLGLVQAGRLQLPS